MASYPNGSRVEVRSSGSAPWYPGEVVRQDHMCWEVDLDSAVTGDQWSGVTRRYGGSDMIGLVSVFKATETVLPGSQIKAEGT